VTKKNTAVKKREVEDADELTAEQMERARFDIGCQQVTFNPFEMESRFAVGWIVSEVDGEPWFSDGSAAFSGAKEGRSQHILPADFARPMTPTVADADRAYVHVYEACATYDLDYLVVFEFHPSDVYIQAKYYFEAIARFPDVKFYVRPEAAEMKGLHKVFCESKGKLVGVIMPHKAPRE
jgi:hypothetical protein